jgi:hypothetical protein
MGLSPVTIGLIAGAGALVFGGVMFSKSINKTRDTGFGVEDGRGGTRRHSLRKSKTKKNK